MTIGLPSEIAIGLVAGFFAGVVHCASLWWNTRLFAAGSTLKAVGLQLARIAVAVAILTALAMLGLPALVAGGLAFLVARPVLMWRFGALR